MDPEEYLKKVIEGVKSVAGPTPKSAHEKLKDDAWFCGNALLFLSRVEGTFGKKEDADEFGLERQELTQVYSRRLLDVLWDESYLAIKPQEGE
jgi:hypothetical protein